MSTLCEVVGCNKEVKARGKCNRHYRQWYALGEPVAVYDMADAVAIQPDPPCEGCGFQAECGKGVGMACQDYWLYTSAPGDPKLRKRYNKIPPNHLTKVYKLWLNRQPSADWMFRTMQDKSIKTLTSGSTTSPRMDRRLHRLRAREEAEFGEWEREALQYI